MAERLSVRNLSRRYGAAGISAVSFAVHDGEILALLGASGCGKTTTLNCIAGLDTPDSGEIAIAGQTVFDAKTNRAADKRGIGMVFQDQVLWPHMSVAAHLDFVLQAARVPASERPARLAAQLQSVQLTARDNALPSELSGGERQRLSIARALVARPALLLLDEPCANLDAHLKHEFLALLLRLLQEQRGSAVYVTHDAAEACAVAQRIAVLDAGRIVQLGTPQDLLESPATPAVAQVMGAGTVLALSREGDELRCAFGPVANHPGATHAFVHPHDCQFSESGPLSGIVRSARSDGERWLILLERNGAVLRASAPQAIASGGEVKFAFKSSLLFF